jgi:hypothetical protein
MITFSLHTILRLLGNESKVHLFPAIFFQEMLPTRVKSHLARFQVSLMRSHEEKKSGKRSLARLISLTNH